jgi:hypothetical protein
MYFSKQLGSFPYTTTRDKSRSQSFPRQALDISSADRCRCHDFADKGDPLVRSHQLFRLKRGDSG